MVFASMQAVCLFLEHEQLSNFSCEQQALKKNHYRWRAESTLEKYRRQAASTLEKHRWQAVSFAPSNR